MRGIARLTLKSLFILALASVSLAGATTANPPRASGQSHIGPRDAIVAAADAAPRGVPGLFAMRVAGTGRIGGRVFLNSEADYRDQRNLTIALSPTVAQQFANRYGAAPEVYFRGRSIEVRGAARRERIHFLDNWRRPTGLYYYQTHVRVTRPDQIVVVD